MGKVHRGKLMLWWALHIFYFIHSAGPTWKRTMCCWSSQMDAEGLNCLTFLMLCSPALFLVPKLSQHSSARLMDLSSEMLPLSPSSLKAAVTGLDPTSGLKSSNHSTLQQTQLTTISHKVFFSISALYKLMAINFKVWFISQCQAFSKHLDPLLVLFFLFCFIFPI